MNIYYPDELQELIELKKDLQRSKGEMEKLIKGRNEERQNLKNILENLIKRMYFYSEKIKNLNSNKDTKRMKKKMTLA